MISLLTQLALATLCVGVTILLHLGYFYTLTSIVRRIAKDPIHSEFRVNQVGLVLLVVFGLFALHGIEIWAYAFLYIFIGALKVFEQALYFSTVTYIAIGYGDVVLPTRWRILGAIEGANGVILLGWSTAFLVSVVQRLRIPERDHDR